LRRRSQPRAGMRMIRALYFGAGALAALLALGSVSLLLAAWRGDEAGGTYRVSITFALAVASLAAVSFGAGSRPTAAAGGRLRSLAAGALFSGTFALLLAAFESWSGRPLSLVSFGALAIFAAGCFFIARRSTSVSVAE
jgi:hypothetical protein